MLIDLNQRQYCSSSKGLNRGGRLSGNLNLASKHAVPSTGGICERGLSNLTIINK